MNIDYGDGETMTEVGLTCRMIFLMSQSMNDFLSWGYGTYIDGGHAELSASMGNSRNGDNSDQSDDERRVHYVIT